ncbi:MAG: hypothetical protein ACXADU_02855 [Promethearchaeota archaeon]|jgi:hypothetical protein
MKNQFRTFSIIIFLLFSIFLINLTQKIVFTQAQGNNDIAPIPAKFDMVEYSEVFSLNESINSIEIPLPSETWNLTNLWVNFSDIKLGQEIISVEEKGQSIQIIDSKGKQGYGVEINVTEPTIIFGVYIYGYMTGIQVKPVYVQVQGYDGGTNSPDENILGSTMINISTPGWHLQTFENEVSLPTGNYYLVINGSELTWPEDKSTYNWFYNDSSTVNPELHTAVYDGTWNEETVGKPFLFKLVQRVNRSFNPEDINMTAVFKDTPYPILDGVAEGTGHLSINEILIPDGDLLKFDINTNQSIGLIFNISYLINIQNIISSEGQIIIKENTANSWVLTPNIEPIYSNYSVRFTYPNLWYNFSIIRNGFNVTSEVIINTIDDYILILNSTILPGATWEIFANSPNVGLSLNIPKTTFQPHQELAFSVLPPVNPGNLSYVLINSLGFIQYNETHSITQVTSEEIVLSYTLSANPNEGVYKAYVYWFDGKNAGIETQEFQVNVPFSLDPMHILIIIVGISIITTVSISSYKIAKRSKRIHEELRHKIYNKFMDVVNLDYFIIIEKRTGLNIYEQMIAAEGIDDAALITGFLEAIRNFGIELTGANEQSQTIKLEYQESKIIMSEFRNFRILLIMKENPSQDFLDSVKELSYDIDEQYGEDIVHFTGNIDKFQNIRLLLNKHLETTLIYPLELNPQDIKLSSEEKSMINRAKDIMKMKKTDYFFVSYMLYAKKGFQVKDAEILLNLIEKKVFQPKT